jgi:hypothetical protein
MIFEIDVDTLRYVDQQLNTVGPFVLEKVIQKYVDQMKAKHHAALAKEIAEFFQAITVKAALVSSDTTSAHPGNVLPVIRLRIEIPDEIAKRIQEPENDKDQAQNGRA